MSDGVYPGATLVLPQHLLKGWDKGYVDRVGFCDHTAGGYYSTLCRVSFWNDPRGDGSVGPLSVHAGISLSGDLVQILNIFDTAYAQGRDQLGNPVSRYSAGISWAPFASMDYRNPNGYLISTEHEDKAGAPIWSPKTYDTDLAFKLWCIRETKRVTGKNLMRFGIESLAGHHMFDPVNRANCPGPQWRKEYRQALYNDILKGLSTDMFTRMPQNAANPGFWSGFQVTGPQGMDARGDFGLDPSINDIEIEVSCSGGLDIMDGDTADGLAFYVDGIQHGRVKLDSNGAFWMRPVGSSTIDWIRCVGYYS